MEHNNINSCCIICCKKYNKEEDSHNPNHHNKVLSVKERDLLKRFLKLFGRHIKLKSKIDSVSSLAAESSTSKDGVLIEKLIDGGIIGACEDCLEIAESFCDLLHQMKMIELNLNWKVSKLKTIMFCASRISSRMEVFKEILNEGQGQDNNDNARMIIKFKANLIKKCFLQQSQTYPKLQLKRVNHNPQPQLPSRKVINADAAPKLDRCTICLKPLLPEAVTTPVANRKEVASTKTATTALTNQKATTIPANQSSSQCKVCTESLTSGDNHKKTVHDHGDNGGRRFICGYCSQSFNRRYNAKRHIKKTHLSPNGKPLPVKLSVIDEVIDESASTNIAGEATAESAKDSSSVVVVVAAATTDFLDKSGVVESPEPLPLPTTESESADAFPETEDSDINYTFPDNEMDDDENIGQGKVINDQPISTTTAITIAKKEESLPSTSTSKEQNKTKISKNNLEYDCESCSKRFPNSHSLLHHKKMVHLGSLYNCGYCSLSFNNHTKAKIHSHKFHLSPSDPSKPLPIAIHFGRRDEAISCHICKKVFTTSIEKREHMKLVHSKNAKLYECKHYGMTFRKLGKYTGHRVNNGCLKTSKESASKTDQIVANDEIMDSSSVVANESTIMNEAPMVSSSPVAASESAIKLHPETVDSNIITSTNNETEEMDSLSDIADDAEQPIPTNELVNPSIIGEVKVFSTQVISLTGSSFSSKKIPTKGKTTFPCKICKLTFKSSSFLQRHRLDVHGGMKAKCETCGKYFKEIHQLSLHTCLHVHMQKPPLKMGSISSILPNDEHNDAQEGEREDTAAAANMIISERSHPSPSIICKNCMKTFETEINLQRHFMFCSFPRENV